MYFYVYIDISLHRCIPILCVYIHVDLYHCISVYVYTNGYVPTEAKLRVEMQRARRRRRKKGEQEEEHRGGATGTERFSTGQRHEGGQTRRNIHGAT